MKTTIITAIIFGMFLATGVSAYALFKVQPLDGFTKITNTLIDNDAVTVYKFTDGNVTCYGSYITKSSTSLSCVNTQAINVTVNQPKK